MRYRNEKLKRKTGFKQRTSKVHDFVASKIESANDNKTNKGGQERTRERLLLNISVLRHDFQCFQPNKAAGPRRQIRTEGAKKGKTIEETGQIIAKY